MSKNKRQQKTQTPEATITAQGINAKVNINPTTSTSGSADLAFGKSNFTFMLIGIGVILLGFFIMTLDKEEFGFGFLGITLGPIVVFCGFMVELYAILKKKR
ncbi:MAG: hypothetical protein ACI9DJ_002444 [Algoriphagus sp.]|jgi:hypothetical protein